MTSNQSTDGKKLVSPHRGRLPNFIAAILLRHQDLVHNVNDSVGLHLHDVIFRIHRVLHDVFICVHRRATHHWVFHRKQRSSRGETAEEGAC